MLVCPQCGVENQLGRVFCNGCGSKLDLSNMSHDSVAESMERTWISRFWWVFVVGAVAIVAAFVFVALWPKPGVLGEAGVRTSGRKVERMLADMGRARPGRGALVRLSDKDINAYFKYIKNLGPNITCKVMPTQVRLRVVNVKNINLKLFVWKPTVSYEMELIPYGTRMVPRRVWIGHLRLMGPAKSPVVRNVHKLFAAQKEWKVMKNVSSLKIQKKYLAVEYEGKKKKK